MSRRELKAAGVRIDRMVIAALAIFLAATPAAFAGFDLANAQQIDGSALIPISALIAAVTMTAKVVWYIATDRRAFIARLDQLEKDNAELTVSIAQLKADLAGQTTNPDQAEKGTESHE